MEGEKDERHYESEPDISSSKGREDAVNIEEKDDKKYPYPKSVLFIISTEFCERFSYYGMKSKTIYINKNICGCLANFSINVLFCFSGFIPIFPSSIGL